MFTSSYHGAVRVVSDGLMASELSTGQRMHAAASEQTTGLRGELVRLYYLTHYKNGARPERDHFLTSSDLWIKKLQNISALCINGSR
jgi:hypothetical protein